MVAVSRRWNPLPCSVSIICSQSTLKHQIRSFKRSSSLVISLYVILKSNTPYRLVTYLKKKHDKVTIIQTVKYLTLRRKSHVIYLLVCLLLILRLRSKGFVETPTQATLQLTTCPFSTVSVKVHLDPCYLSTRSNQYFFHLCHYTKREYLDKKAVFLSGKCSCQCKNALRSLSMSSQFARPL